MGKIQLSIDGQQVEAEAGQTVLQAARRAGISIPTICDHKDLSPYGACRMCVVEIDGLRGYPTSCTTPVAEGMVVRTQTEALRTLRNRTLELMFSGHPNSCLVCPHREDCERYRPKAAKAARSTRCGFCANRDECDLRDMALKAGGSELHLPPLYAAHALERDDPFMDRDYNLCVLCGRCWRICGKIHGQPAISIINRGKRARIGTAFGQSHVDSGCLFCGACIDICPTGTLSDRFARWQGKADAVTSSTCILCAHGCALRAETKDGQLAACLMPGFATSDRLCALGRFGYAQMVNHSRRLIRPFIREGQEAIPVAWDSAIQRAAKQMQAHAGAIAFLVSESCSREDRYLYRLLAQHLQAELRLLPPETSADSPLVLAVLKSVQAGRITAVFANGDFIGPELRAALDLVVIADCFSSTSSDQADMAFPLAVLSEIEGTYLNTRGEIKQLAASSVSPGEARPEWRVIAQIGQELGCEQVQYTAVAAITSTLAAHLAAGQASELAPIAPKDDPRDQLRALPARFRGHLCADLVPSLTAFGLPATPVEHVEESQQAEGFLVVEHGEIAPNMHRLRIQAPQVAKYAQPGQFVILMTRETSERSPFTLVDWDAEQGSITVVIEELGRSSRELTALRPGMRMAHVSGPLGLPLPIKQVGTVFLGAGCYGLGAILPLARALRRADNRVLCAIEASSSYLLYMEAELAAAADQLLIATKDGSRGQRGGVQELFHSARAAGRLDQCIFIGCTFMMRMASEITREAAVPTLVGLNPIMVDGTGMCGACRVSIGGEMRFACVDGPLVDGHAVDWDELDSRRSAYARQEVQALRQGLETMILPRYQAKTSGCGCNEARA